MKRILIVVTLSILAFHVKSQITTLAPNYKVIDIGWNGYGDYTKSLILLHEIYSGTLIEKNYTIGTIQAMRGDKFSWNRTNAVTVYTSSAYNGISGAIQSIDNSDTWKLRTCVYNGKKYIAVEVPYSAAFHNHGFKFCGWTYSSGENMKCVSYEVKGQPVNQDVLTGIADFSPDMNEYHSVANFIVNGNVGIGTENPANKLDVNGTIRAKEVKVESNWADFVFKPDYQLRPLSEVAQFINANGHLPEIPTEKEVAQNGVSLGEMNAKLLQKVEELTLYLIEKDKKINDLERRVKHLEKQ